MDWALGSLILWLCALTYAGSIERVTETVPEGTTFVFRASSDNNVYGNDITQRNVYLATGAKKSYVDTTTSLPRGTLRQFFIFVHPKGNLSSYSTAKLQLQIWRPMGDNSFSLVYTTEMIQLNMLDRSGTFYKFLLSDNFGTEARDYIGWTNEDTVCPISLTYTASHKVYSRHVDGDHFPTVERQYLFDNTYTSAAFSVAVEIKPYASIGNPDIFSQRVTAGSSFVLTVTPERDLYGNDVKARDIYLNTNAKKSYIDQTRILPRGLLSKFFIFVHPKKDLSTINTTNIMLQIWHPIDRYNYRLMFSTAVMQVNLVEGHGTYMRFSLTQDFHIDQGDLIGWTNEGDACPISFSYDQAYKVLTRQVVGNSFPQIGDPLRFEEIYIPAVFSIAIEIKTSRSTTTTPAAPPIAPQPPLPSNPDFIVAGGTNGFYGNDVKQRANILSSGSRKSFIDVDNRLPRGVVTRFAIYVSKIDPSVGEASERMWLQIWRAVNTEMHEYRLVWSVPIELKLSQREGSLLTFGVDSLPTQIGDFIGWGCEGNVGPLSFDFTSSHRTFFRPIVGNDYPVIDQAYIFDEIHLPAEFSIAVELRVAEDPVFTNPSPSPVISTTASSPAGFFLPNDGQHYGNDIISRSSYLPSGARTSYIEFETSLPSGYLEKFYLYIHHLETSDAIVGHIRLQIWRPAPMNALWFTLVWSKSVTITTDDMRKGVYEYILTDNFRVEEGDYIGWTNENDYCLISFEFKLKHRTLYLSSDGILDTSTPEVNKNYMYSGLYMSNVFSVGVKIVNGISNSTSVTTNPITTLSSSTTSIPKTTTTSHTSINIITLTGQRKDFSIGEGFYGNNVTRREQFTVENIRRSFIDYDNVLPSGRLNQFFMFAHYAGYLYKDSPEYEKIPIHLQIWRPSSLTGGTYQLVWSTRIEADMTKEEGMLYNIRVIDDFDTIAGDRLGWTNEDRTGPISFNYGFNQRIFYKRWNGSSEIPQLNHRYDFDPDYFPGVFSVAVEINPITYIPTTATTTSTTKPTTSLTTSPTTTTSAPTTTTVRTTTTTSPLIVSESNTSINIITMTGQRKDFSKGEGFYGNNVTKRGQFTVEDIRRSFLDYDNVLPSGRLSQFFMFAHYTGDAYQNHPEFKAIPVHLQIWRPVSWISGTYQLVWSKRIEVDMTKEEGMLYHIRVIDDFDTMVGDRLGWTNEDRTGPISFSYGVGQRLFYKKWDSSSKMLQLNNIYDFNPEYVSGVFSIAVEINPIKFYTAPPKTVVPHFTLSPTLQTDETEEFRLKPGSGFHGNDVIRRSTFLPRSSQSYVDFNSVLPKGSLEVFYVYLHDVSSRVEAIGEVYLQIWRPIIVEENTNVFKLVWSQRVAINVNTIQIGLLKYVLKSGAGVVERGDRIGWTYQSVGVISMDYVRTHRTYFTQPGTPFTPVVGKNYTFSNNYLRSVFSVAVKINTGNTDEKSENEAGSVPEEIQVEKGFPWLTLWISLAVAALVVGIAVILTVVWYRKFAKKHWPFGTDVFKDFDPKRYDKYFK